MRFSLEPAASDTDACSLDLWTVPTCPYLWILVSADGRKVTYIGVVYISGLTADGR